MALSYYADRVNLYQVMQQHPGWSSAELAHVLKRSRSWVSKWRQRFHAAPADLVALQKICQGESHAPKHPPVRVDPVVEEQILAIRDQPPEGLRRTPGPKAIQYFLARDPQLQLFQLPIPGTRTSHTHPEVASAHSFARPAPSPAP
jgi:hypothetical protein